MLLIPDLETGAGRAAMPSGIRAMSAIVWLFLLAVAVFCIFIGVGVLRRRNWARISILVWAGIMAAMSAITIPFLFIVFNALPAMMPKDGNTAPVLSFMKWFSILFYGIPLGVGIWWLVLFTRKRVSVAFTNPAQAAALPSEMDPSGFPSSEPAVQRLPGPSCPLPLMILSVFFIFSAFCVLLMVVLPMPFALPMVLFGHLFASGIAPKLFLVLTGGLTGAAGFGMLKLKPWALYTALVVQAISLVNVVVSALSPNLSTIMNQAMLQVYSQNPAFAENSPLLGDSFFRTIMIFTSLFCVAIIVVLLWQRSRFLEAASAAKA